jgi:type I restriction enzyme S subunit
LVTFKTGRLDSNAAVPNGIYPFFTCSQETLRTNTYSFDTECVLLAGNNATGIFPLKYHCGKFDAYQRTYVIVPRNTSVLLTRYLYYALWLKLSEFHRLSTGVATKFLTLTILNATEVALPEVATQRRIAGVLSAYDDLIENCERRIRVLDQMARALYREWFVLFRYPGHEKVPLVESPLGPIPKGWETTPIGDVVPIFGGGTPSRKDERYWVDGTVPWFSPTDITRAGTMFLDDSSERITERGLAESSARLFPALSVMMTSRATIGAIAINTTAACTNQGFIVCTPSNRLPQYLLFHWLRTNVPLFGRMASGSTFKEISRGVFKGILTFLPPVSLVSRFETYCEPIGAESLSLQRRIANLRKTRDLLLPRLLSGQLAVEAAE